MFIKQSIQDITSFYDIERFVCFMHLYCKFKADRKQNCRVAGYLFIEPARLLLVIISLSAAVTLFLRQFFFVSALDFYAINPLDIVDSFISFFSVFSALQAWIIIVCNWKILRYAFCIVNWFQFRRLQLRLNNIGRVCKSTWVWISASVQFSFTRYQVVSLALSNGFIYGNYPTIWWWKNKEFL